MEEVIWIEVLSRHRDVVARHRCTGREIRIGRGYHNDVVLDDAYVAPAHIRIARDESGALFAEDLGSVNGLFEDRRRQRLQRIRIDGRRAFRIGQTVLRVREAGYPIAPERRFEARSWRWLAAGVLGGAVLAIEILWLWLGETGEPKLTRYVTPLFGVVMMLLAWVAAWSILSRIFAGEARFERNLVIALAGLLAYSLYNELAAFAAFALSSKAIATRHDMLLWVLLAVVAFFHLRAIGPTRLKLKAGAVTALALAVVGVQALSQSEVRETFGQQASLHRLLPPMFRLAPIKDNKAFVAEIGALRQKLDQDRKSEPSTGFFGTLFGGDED